MPVISDIKRCHAFVLSIITVPHIIVLNWLEKTVYIRRKQIGQRDITILKLKYKHNEIEVYKCPSLVKL